MTNVTVRREILVAFALAVAGLSGCGAETPIMTEENRSGGVTAETGAATQVAETTAPTTIGQSEAAGEYYSQISAEFNCSSILFQLAYTDWSNAWLNASPRVSAYPSTDEGLFQYWKDELSPYANQLANELLQFVSSLGTYSWPTNVQEPVDELIEIALKQASDFTNYSSISSPEDLRNWEWPTAPTRNPGGVIRAKLGLPSNVNSNEDYCRSIDG